MPANSGYPASCLCHLCATGMLRLSDLLFGVACMLATLAIWQWYTNAQCTGLSAGSTARSTCAWVAVNGSQQCMFPGLLVASKDLLANLRATCLRALAVFVQHGLHACGQDQFLALCVRVCVRA